MNPMRCETSRCRAHATWLVTYYTLSGTPRSVKGGKHACSPHLPQAIEALLAAPGVAGRTAKVTALETTTSEKTER